MKIERNANTNIKTHSSHYKSTKILIVLLPFSYSLLQIIKFMVVERENILRQRVQELKKNFENKNIVFYVHS